jgi:putative PEP-CTERM system TPR-repeat lipoprotein
MSNERLRRVLAGPAMLLLLGLPSLAPADDADQYVAEARAYIASGEYKAAVIQLKNALREAPANVDARLLLGSLYLRELDGPSAEKEYRRARELGAPVDSWLAGYARALVLQRDFSRLLAEVDVVDGLDPALAAEVHALRGNAHLALGQTERAGAAYDRALALEPGQALASLGKAQLLLAAGDQAGAKAQLDAVIARHPEQAEALLVRGDLNRRSQDLDAARADYAAAAAAQPNNPRAQVGLALVNLASRDLEAAQQAVERLRELAPQLPVRHYLQALLSFQQRDLDRASEELQLLLRTAPGNLQAQLLYGIVSYGRDEFAIADDYLTRVLASAPGNTQIVKLLGAARLKLRQPDRAVAVLAPVVDPSTDDAQLLALLGTAYLQTGDNTRGAELIERAVALDPDQALLRTQLAVGKIAAGDTGAAITQLESAVALGQDVIQADVLLVLSYLNKREFDKAIEASTALEARMSDSPIPFNLTGLAYLAQRDFATAAARFEQALEIDPDFVVARMNLARLAQVAQRPDDAERAYRAVLAREPTHLGAMMGLSALARSQGDAQGAEDWLVQATQAHPSALQPILQLAEIDLRRNEGLKAVNLLSGIDPEQAQLPAVLRLRGMAQLQSGDFASAVFTLGQLTEVQPDSIEAWFQLARAHAAAGDNARSRAAFERATALDVEHRTPVVWVGLGELELRDGQFDAALAVAERVRELFPGNVAAYDIAAAAHRGLGDIPSALVAAGAALELDPSSLRANRYARALAASGDAEGAIQVLNDWVSEQPADGAAWSNLGLIEQQFGREEAALQAYEQAVRHAQPNPVVLNNMAWLYTDRDPQRAVELATQAYELAPSRAEIVDTYGWVLFQSGRRDEGLAALQQALIIAPRNAEIALHVAEALIEMQRADEARPMLERVLRDHPGSPFAESARVLLDRPSG